jgi:TniQ
MTSSLVRRLPVTSPPAPYETVASYLRRLERINHLRRDVLPETVTASRRPPQRELSGDAIDIERLSTLSGFPADILRHAIPSLRRPQPPRRLFHRYARPACPGCAGRRQRGQVRCLLPSYAYVCVRHRTWIGGQPASWVHDHEPPLNVSRLPVLITAQRRHHRLIRRHGQQAAAEALLISQQSLERWLHGMFPMERQAARLDILLHPEWEHISMNHPAYFASYYPEAVRLTGLLLSPYWHSLAADPSTRDQFFQEVGRRRDAPRSYFRPEWKDEIHGWIKKLA